MSAPASDVVPASAVGRFADELLAADLPGLDPARRIETVVFIEGRAVLLPSITRFGVRLIGGLVDAAARVLGPNRARSLVLRVPLPLLREYPRLLRSLGYAYVWERWPDTLVDGSDGAAS